MPTLPDDLFSLVESKTLAAREAGEKAARNILAYFRVESGTWWGKKDDPQRDLWLALRARARQLGFSQEETEEKDPVKRGIVLLVEEIAYEQWHRMLFARFLADNNLLMHPSGVPVSLQDCEELASKEGEDDAWWLAARYASAMLPGIFKLEDPCANVRLTPNDHHNLEKILLDIPQIVFTCDDSLGWMYQFWQSKKKDEVNASERKIGGADLPPVTQLFTEDYMVRFLLENSLGAWWTARHPDSPLIKEWKYLRFKEDGTPAAGTFPGWPQRAAEVTVMDPCCGSGHFLISAFDMLHKMRMEEEGINPTEATTATLRDNIFGLEIDQRCTQIAGFALSLIGWKTGGYQKLPELNVACTGIPVQGQLESWLELAGDDSRLKAGLERLYNLFKNAPDLGSLINPGIMPEVDRMFVADYDQVGPLFEKALANEKNSANDQASMTGVDLVKAARLLNKTFTLVATNVPYLGEKKQNSILRSYCSSYFPESKADLATVFIERSIKYLNTSGSIIVVSPQNWLHHKTSKALRHRLISESSWNVVVRLGTGAFSTIGGEIVNVSLVTLTNKPPKTQHKVVFINVSTANLISQKIEFIFNLPLIFIFQSSQLANPDYRILEIEVKQESLLENYADAYSGINTGEIEKFNRYFWEIDYSNKDWEFLQETTDNSSLYGGRYSAIYWQEGEGEIYRLAQKLRHQNHVIQNWRRGQPAWNNIGIAINNTGNLRATIYTGNKFYCSVTVIVPKKREHLIPIWLFCSSNEYKKLIRIIDTKLGVTTANFIKVPFELEYWNTLVSKEFPTGLPEPFSNDPTQWLFEGNPAGSPELLQVAVAKLLGYYWPKQSKSNVINSNNDGIVCLPSIKGNQSAAEWLRALLAEIYGNEWSVDKLEDLLTSVGYSGKDLASWLMDGFLLQHCRLFKNHPFIWHIWDGRKDGFSALVNYHKLDHANLEKLTYTYLGSWITDRKSEVSKGIAGAEGRFLAAQALQDKLKLILEGEPPYDIYVRWKALHEQPIGWNPDLNDGVRLNIRPFIMAGILRSKFTINWNKDRGKNLDGSERLNDLHYTNEEKREARRKIGRKLNKE